MRPGAGREIGEESELAHKELVIAWLNDAHAMEFGIAQVLEWHVEEAKDHP